MGSTKKKKKKKNNQSSINPVLSNNLWKRTASKEQFSSIVTETLKAES